MSSFPVPTAPPQCLYCSVLVPSPFFFSLLPFFSWTSPWSCRRSQTCCLQQLFRPPADWRASRGYCHLTRRRYYCCCCGCGYCCCGYCCCCCCCCFDQSSRYVVSCPWCLQFLFRVDKNPVEFVRSGMSFVLNGVPFALPTTTSELAKQRTTPPESPRCSDLLQQLNISLSLL